MDNRGNNRGNATLFQKALASLPKIGEPYTKGLCPIHGDNSSLNRVGKCVCCTNAETKKQYSLRRSQLSFDFEY